MNDIFYTDKIKTGLTGKQSLTGLTGKRGSTGKQSLTSKRGLTRKRKRNENNNGSISGPQLKKAKIMFKETENQINNLEDVSVSKLFSKLSFKNSRAAKAAITRKLNRLKEKEKALKLILKARTRSQLKKLLENKKY